MKSKFEYIIDRDDDNKITGRSIQITITDKTMEAARTALYNLERYIKTNGYNSYEFAGCPFQEEEIGEFGDNIIISDREEMEEVKVLYKAWKKVYKNQ